MKSLSTLLVDLEEMDEALSDGRLISSSKYLEILRNSAEISSSAPSSSSSSGISPSSLPPLPPLPPFPPNAPPEANQYTSSASSDASAIPSAVFYDLAVKKSLKNFSDVFADFTTSYQNSLEIPSPPKTGEEIWNDKKPELQDSLLHCVTAIQLDVLADQHFHLKEKQKNSENLKVDGSSENTDVSQIDEINLNKPFIEKSHCLVVAFNKLDRFFEQNRDSLIEVEDIGKEKEKNKATFQDCVSEVHTVIESLQDVVKQVPNEAEDLVKCTEKLEENTASLDQKIQNSQHTGDSEMFILAQFECLQKVSNFLFILFLLYLIEHSFLLDEFN